MNQSGLSLEAVRRVSKAVLGSRFRLEAAAEIAAHDDDVFYAGELDVPDASVSQVAAELEHFEDAGLVTRLDRSPGERMQYYRRETSVYWTLALELLEEIQRRPP